jgi:hypothetical protein
MNEKTEQRLTGWGSIALGVIALVITGLASIVRGLTANIPVPLWVFLVAVLLGFVLVLRLMGQSRRNLTAADNARTREHEEHDRENKTQQLRYDELSDSHKSLEASVERANALVFKNGAYFRTGDTDLTQPFCRVCLDSRGEPITVSEEAPWDSDFNGFLPIYYCPACKRGHPRQVVEPKPVDDDEENLL